MPWIVGAVGLLLGLAFFVKPKEQVITDTDETVDANDVEALARMLASENPHEADFVQVALAWSAVNMAGRRNRSVYLLLAPDGRFGPQTGRYASTVNEATDKFRSIAKGVLMGVYPDPTGGAIQFDNPSTQDWLYEHGKASKDAARVASDRVGEGRTLFVLPGISPDHLRFWV